MEECSAEIPVRSIRGFKVDYRYLVTVLTVVGTRTHHNLFRDFFIRVGQHNRRRYSSRNCINIWTRHSKQSPLARKCIRVSCRVTSTTVGYALFCLQRKIPVHNFRCHLRNGVRPLRWSPKHGCIDCRTCNCGTGCDRDIPGSHGDHQCKHHRQGTSNIPWGHWRHVGFCKCSWACSGGCVCCLTGRLAMGTYLRKYLMT